MKHYLFLVFLIVSCSSACGTPERHSVDVPKQEQPHTQQIIPIEQVQIWMEDFRIEMEKRGISVNYGKIKVIMEVSLPGDEIGYFVHNPITELDEVHFLISALCRRLIYHELGHALWDLPHSNVWYDIMYYRNQAHTDPTPQQLDDMAKQIKDWTRE